MKQPNNTVTVLTAASSAATSMALAVICLELILNIATLPNIALTAETDAKDTVKNTIEVDDSNKLTRSEIDETPARSRVNCTTNFHAIFQTDNGKECAANPTVIMAHWGPPTDQWFRSMGGHFIVQKQEVLPTQQCACLQSQPAFMPASGLGAARPTSLLEHDGRKLIIEKWVCGDECPVNSKNNSDDS